jgi:predicted AAA+ superfamily ATPase
MGLIRDLLSRLHRVLGLAERMLDDYVGPETSPSFFDRHLAFRWVSGSGAGHLVPIEQPACFDLDDLIGVESAVAALDRNTRQLIAGLPFNNVLLYGERGTGKSSAVRGLIQRHADAGLRMVEVERTDLIHLPRVLAALRTGGAHSFIIFCDDLSFGFREEGYRELKAALEGSLESRPANVCIAATSNRRHLVPETMSENRQARVDEEGELHLGEALDEKLALSERFGLVLGFYNFDQNTYLAIVEQYLRQGGIPELSEDLRRSSLQWALRRGSRSGRTARQFVDDTVGRLRLEAKPRQ